jgi:RNA polymerase sigma-70 factor (ECF subfamily)
MGLQEPPPLCPADAREEPALEGFLSPGVERPWESPSKVGRPVGADSSPVRSARVIKLPVRARERDAGRSGGQPQPMDRERHEHWVRDVVARNRGLLVAEANKYCRNAADADDLVQDTLLRFVQSTDKPGAPTDERGCVLLLLTILTRRFFDQCRRRRVRARHAEDPQPTDEGMDPSDPETPPLFESVTDEQLAQATQSLSPKLRATFELHAKGLKYREIADELDTTIGTVSKRIFDARARVREFLLKLLKRE